MSQVKNIHAPVAKSNDTLRSLVGTLFVDAGLPEPDFYLSPVFSGHTKVSVIGRFAAKVEKLLASFGIDRPVNVVQYPTANASEENAGKLLHSLIYPTALIFHVLSLREELGQERDKPGYLTDEILGRLSASGWDLTLTGDERSRGASCVVDSAPTGFAAELCAIVAGHKWMQTSQSVSGYSLATLQAVEEIEKVSPVVPVTEPRAVANVSNKAFQRLPLIDLDAALGKALTVDDMAGATEAERKARLDEVALLTVSHGINSLSAGSVSVRAQVKALFAKMTPAGRLESMQDLTEMIEADAVSVAA